MDDRDLLELAAKSVGFEICPVSKYYYPARCLPDAKKPQLLIYNIGIWDPLNDDGDALRLAVAARIKWNCAEYPWFVNQMSQQAEGEALDHDENAVIRRAIVRAAAEIGRGMK